MASAAAMAMAALTALSAAGGLGYSVGTAMGAAELERARHTLTRAQATQAEQASRLLLDAQARGDALTTRLETANHAARRLQENLDDALRRATTGRACLREPVLRLLDHAAGLRADLPPPAGGAAAADGRIASDTDVARWIGRARHDYDECRRRLDALIDWHEQGKP
jgi:hypothetical protein